MPEANTPRPPLPTSPFLDSDGVEWRNVPGCDGRYIVSRTGIVVGPRGKALRFQDRGPGAHPRVCVWRQGQARNVMVTDLVESAFGDGPANLWGRHRYRRGEGHHLTRHSDSFIREIREVAEAEQLSSAEASRRYGVGQMTAWNWIYGRKRADAGGPIRAEGSFDSHAVHRKLTADGIRDIFRYYGEGVPPVALARGWGVSPPTIYALLTGRAWSELGLPVYSAIPSASPRPSLAGLPAEVVRLTRKRVAAGESISAVARELGVHFNAVNSWVHGRCRVDAGGPIAGRDYPVEQLVQQANRRRRAQAQPAGPVGI